MTLFSSLSAFVLAATLSFSSAAFAAASTNPGNWARGDAHSLYVEWDVFNASVDNTPDIGATNISVAEVAETAGGYYSGKHQPRAALAVCDKAR